MAHPPGRQWLDGKLLCSILKISGFLVPFLWGQAAAVAEMPPHLARIDALAPNQAMIIGKASVAGDMNAVARKFGLHRTGPQGRDYSIKMVWAPELQQALFTGANHGSPHRLNDVWAFDLARMEWILLYAPDQPRSYKGLGADSSDVEYRDGVLQTRRGGPAIIAHTWWGLTYDSKRRQLLFMNTWVADQDRAVRTIGADPRDRFKGPPLWAFDPHERQWSFVHTQRPWPRVRWPARIRADAGWCDLACQ